MSSAAPQRLRPFRVTPWIDLDPFLAGLELVCASLGPHGDLYVLAAAPPLSYREKGKGGASFAKVVPDRPNDFVVLRYDGHGVTRSEIAGQPWNFHHVQPLPGGELLLVCARSRYRSPRDYDLNAHVFRAADGGFRRSFLVGDGVKDVQATEGGQVWVSYFDEGVFGNYGWDTPVGHSGLTRWGREGERLYEYSPDGSLDTICDCYALNVVSDREAWCCYYTDFPLVRIVEDRVAAWWPSPVQGADAFAVSRHAVLMRGGYDARDEYHLLRLLPGGSVREHGGSTRYVLVDRESGERLVADRAVARADRMLLLSGSRCYRVSVDELLYA